LGANSKESPHSQQEAHKENKLTNNGYKYVWEEGAVSLG